MSASTREVELKARVADVDAVRRALHAAGATLVFDGELHDRLYDKGKRELSARDHVLRLRTYVSADGSSSAHLDWKGPTSRDDGFKVREELTTGITEPSAMSEVLDRLGYSVVGSIDRRIAQYEMSTGDGSVTLRFETYPRMDDLVEVEGSPAAIEDAIRATGIARQEFSARRLTDFVRDFEARTGQKSAIRDSDMSAT